MDLINAWWAIIRDGVHHIQPVQFVIIGLIFVPETKNVDITAN